MNFSGSATGGAPPYTYRWNFGDGQSSTFQNPSHTYSAAGNYTATLTVSDSQSATDSKSLTINVTTAANPLIASASASPSSGQAPLTVNFTGNATGGTSPYNYSWNFGDGGTSGVQNPTHTFAAQGNYSAILTVVDNQSTTTTASVSITVTSVPSQLIAAASAVPTSGPAPLTVNFTGTPVGGVPPCTYSWAFGDGGTSTIQNPAHTYLVSGSYAATLTVTDSNSSNATSTVNIAVGSITAYGLSISSETGSPSPGQGGTTDPSPGNHSYPVGSSVQAKSLPNTDYRFSKWSGDIVETSIFNSQTIITMDKNKSLSASFCTKCGDVNGDLKITPADAQAAFDFFLGKIANPTWCEKENADVNSSGTKLDPKVTPADAQIIFHKYLKKGVAAGDCSGNSRSATLSIENLIRPDTRLAINNVTVKVGEYIYIPILIESSSEVSAFGFDLRFPAKNLAFIRVERTDLTADYAQLDANVLADFLTTGSFNQATPHEKSYYTLRVGGYRTNPTQEPSSGVLVTLVFRLTGEIEEARPITITATYDDIQNASITNGMISRRQTRENPRQLMRTVEKMAKGKTLYQ